MALYRLVYASTSLLSDDADTARQQIADILSASRRNNAADDITGALLFSDTNFAQVLEGPRAAVERLYETLHHDPAIRTCSCFSPSRSRRGSFRNGRWPISVRANRRQEALALAAEGVDETSQGNRVRRLLALMSETLHRGAAKQAP